MKDSLTLYALKYSEPDFVIISQNGKEIPCHKFILAHRSQVRIIFEWNWRVPLKDKFQKLLL